LWFIKSANMCLQNEQSWWWRQVPLDKHYTPYD